jgi:glycerol-3-phosphate dehydrogenase
LDGAASEADLGVSFGGGLYQVEVDWLCREEWAAMPDDVLWRRTKTGLHMTPDQRKSVADYIARMRSG